MKISLNWLKDYLTLDLDVDTVSQLLTDIGLEVEAVTDVESVKGGMKGVVIGEVVECAKHPNADKLSITKVSVGDGKQYGVVCGAPNVAAGQKVLLATVGTTIYQGDSSFEIKKAKIRGEESEGMICAEDELGLGTSHDGIMVLPADAPLGMPAAEYFNVTGDVVFEIGLTPNRADAASHLGVARDLNAALRARGYAPSSTVRKPDLTGFATDNPDLPVDIEIADSAACKRYTGITVNNITVKPSPDWLANRLKAIGVRPINNVVDVTNYVLFEYGQPLHAFDVGEISGNKVVVRKLNEGTPFTTLDHVERKLAAADLMICNAEGPMCIAGVFGGIDSGITERSKAVFIESAYFDPVHVRKTARRHGLQTDASFRFERGTDPEITVDAAKRAAMLIKEVAGGEISSTIIDRYPEPVMPRIIDFSHSWLTTFLGGEIPAQTVEEILESLEIRILERSGDTLKLEVPAFKVDIFGPADIAEEVLRIYGYNKIEAGDGLHSSISYSQKPDKVKLTNLAAEFLVANGFSEIMNNSLTASAYYEKGWFDRDKCVDIVNPLSNELNVMRQSMVFGMLESIKHNINHKHPDNRFFEFGETYLKAGLSGEVTDKYKQQRNLVIAVTGLESPENWYRPSAKSDYYQLKSVIWRVLLRLGVDPGQFTLSGGNPGWMGMGETYQWNEKSVLSLGEVSAEMLRYFEIHQPVFYAELNWDVLVAQLDEHALTYREVSRFPAVRRDLALELDKSVTYRTMLAIANNVGGSLLKKVNLFDVYEGDKIEKGKKSYALSFQLQDPNKTLTDKEIDALMERMARAFEKEAGARVRR